MRSEYPPSVSPISCPPQNSPQTSGHSFRRIIRSTSLSTGYQIVLVGLSKALLQETEGFECVPGRPKVGTFEGEGQQVIEVIHHVDVEGGFEQAHREAHKPGPGYEAVEFRAHAHGRLSQHVVVAAHSDQIVAPIVGRSEDKILPVEEAERLLY